MSKKIALFVKKVFSSNIFVAVLSSLLTILIFTATSYVYSAPLNSPKLPSDIQDIMDKWNSIKDELNTTDQSNIMVNPNTANISSPNGEFFVSVTDNGIILNGPSGKIQLDGASIKIDAPVIEVTSEAATKLNSTVMEISNSALTKISGGIIDMEGQQIYLNGSDKQVSGTGDATLTMPGQASGKILTGSHTVFMGK